MKGTRHTAPPPPPKIRRTRKRTAREEILIDAIIEAIRWLDVQAPGRAHNVLTEALRGQAMRIVFHGD